MKRLIMLAVLCAFVLGAATAQAVDLKTSGSYIFETVWQDNWAFNTNDDTSAAASSATNNQVTGITKMTQRQRLNVQFDFVANENLKAVLYLRNTEDWGEDGLATGAESETLGIRRAYLDFNYPDTSVNVKVGYMGLSLPAAIGGGSQIHDDETAAVVVSGAFTDNVGYLLGYARAVNIQTDMRSNIDAYIAALPLSFEGISFVPFGAMANIGKEVGAAETTLGLRSLNATDPTSGSSFDGAYWLGAAFTMDLFDPFVFKADLNYGNLDSDANQNKKSGWFADAALEYKGFDMFTPELFFAYSSGEDGNSTKGDGSSERMPAIAASNWAVGSFFFGGDTLLDGSMPNRPAQAGFWTVGLTLKDIQSFAEGLTHTATLLYAQGTNDKTIGSAYTTTITGSNNYNVVYGRTLTEEDSLVEFDFNTAYKVYDELTLSLDFGYINLDSKESVWGTDQKGGDAWKISTGLVYSF